MFAVLGENEGEESYGGGPSRPDFDMLLTIMTLTGNFNLKTYVMDGSGISNIDINGSQSLEKYDRCGY